MQFIYSMAAAHNTRLLFLFHANARLRRRRRKKKKHKRNQRVKNHWNTWVRVVTHLPRFCCVDDANNAIRSNSQPPRPHNEEQMHLLWLSIISNQSDAYIFVACITSEGSEQHKKNDICRQRLHSGKATAKNTIRKKKKYERRRWSIKNSARSAL